MNRTAGIVLVVVVVLCVAGVVAWFKFSGNVPPVTPPSTPTAEKPVTPAPATPAPAPAPPQAQAAVPPAQAEVLKEAPPEAPTGAASKEDPFGGKPITVETLTGCKEVQKIGDNELRFEYAKDGKWLVNGNPRAQWTIEGNRVKIYKDGTDEVHYIDIVGNKLVYNGKECNMTR